MLVAFAYHLDAASPGIQSGRPHSLLRHFGKAGLEVARLFPLQESGAPRRNLTKIWNHLRGRQYLLDRDEDLLRGFADQLHSVLERTSADFLFGPSTLPLSYLETDLPITFCADAPFCAMRGYYQSFTTLSPRQIDLAEKLEADVLRRTALAVYPTKWAAEAAIRHYGIDPERVAEIPFGANFGSANRRAEVEEWIERRAGVGPIRLLFVGREWKRKGGDLVLATAEWLQKRGLKVCVDIVGNKPWLSSRRGVEVCWHGTLNARDVSQTARLSELFQKAHFVFVPSRAEAFGMTFCEANAFGVPVVTTATGGISSIVRDGENGVALPLEAGPEAYGAWIEEQFTDPARYSALASSSFREFETRLNWDAHTRVFLDRVKQIPTAAEPREETALPEARPLHAAFIADAYTDPTKISSWSGTPYFAKRALERHGVRFTVVQLDERSARLRRWANFLWYRFFRHQRYLRDRHPRLLRAFARQIRQRLREIQPDIVFTMATAPITYLQAECPIAYWVDATFTGMAEFYRSFSDLAEVSVRDTYQSDCEALRRSSLAIYSSEWAAESARTKYAGDTSRVHFVNLGANLDRTPTAEEIATVIRRRERWLCRLLFIGVDWERKGADQAIAIAEAVVARGVPVRLSIIGCQPPPGRALPDCVEVIGFLNKQSAEDNSRIVEHFRQSHFFVLPTRAEAYGMVFCEASAYGLPSLAPRVGGIPSIIEHGKNGWLLPVDAAPMEYADLLVEKWQDRAAYEAMAADCHRIYTERLNWDAAAGRVVALMRACVQAWPTSANPTSL